MWEVGHFFDRCISLQVRTSISSIFLVSIPNEHVPIKFYTGLPVKGVEVQKSKAIQTVRSQNTIRPPVPAKQQGSRSHTATGYQTLPLSFRSSHKTDGQAHVIDSAEDLKHHSLTYKFDHCVKVTKKIDDSAIGGSETDSSYDDVDTQPLKEMCSGTTESYNSSVSHLSGTELGSYNECDSPRLPQTQLSSRGYHSSAIKEIEDLKNLVHQLSVRVKVL